VGQPLEVHIRTLQEYYWSEDDPDGRAFVPLADALRRAGDLREAHRLLRDGLARHPDFLSAHVVAGWLGMDRGDLDDADDRFRTALELDPKNLSALRGLAEVLLERGEKDSAIGVLETLSQEDPVDLTLPARILELRARPTVDASGGSSASGEPGPPLWDDAEEVAEELDWEGAVLQRDASAGPETDHEGAEDRPEVVPIESLAPDRTHPTPVQELAPKEFLYVEALAPQDPVPIGALAPDEPIPIGSLAPDGPIPIEFLAPDGPIPIEFLAPEDLQ